MATYTIVGGHGKIALLTAPLLRAAGHTVIAIIRNPDHASDVTAVGATPLVLDVEHASQAELASAFRGSDAVVWSAGAGGGNPQRTYAVDRDAAIRSIDAAAEAGVPRYVMVSYFGAGPDHGRTPDEAFFAYADAKTAADAYLRESSLAWTVLGPASLTNGEPSGTIDLAPLAEGTPREISRANVALSITAALATDHTIGKTLRYVDGSTPVGEAFARA